MVLCEHPTGKHLHGEPGVEPGILCPPIRYELTPFSVDPFSRSRCSIPQVPRSLSKRGETPRLDLLPDWMMADRLLLGKTSLETCPAELRQSLAYVLHLRSYWKPEGRAKLIVPTSWMVRSSSSSFLAREPCLLPCTLQDVFSLY